MVGVQELFQLIVITFDILSKTAYFGLIISSTIGQFIVKYTLTFLTFICTIFATILDVIKVLYEDYCIFVLDVVDKGICIGSAIISVAQWCISTVYNCWGTTKNICYAMYEFLILSLDTVYSVAVKVINCISNIPEVLKNLATLVGSGIWLAISIIPLGFVYTSSMCVFLIGRSCEEMMSLIDSIRKGILCILYGSIQFLYDIPLEAQAGLILGTIILYASMKYHTHIIQCFVYLCDQMKFILHCMWTSLERLLLSIFTNQNHEVDPVEPLENEESSDESDNSQALNSSSDNSLLNLRSRVVSRVEHGKQNITKQHLLHQLEQEQESKLCVICQDRNKCVIIFPCRHLCLCTECCTVIQQEHRSCPMCRQIVRRTMKVYI